MAVETPMTIDTNEPPPTPAQPVDLLALEAQIKEASDTAQATGQDPAKLTTFEFAQGSKTAVPEKFKTATGEVDVEKLKTSTKQLDQAIEAKEAAVQKSVDDYLEKQRKFRNLPNVAKLQPGPEPPPAPAAAPQAPLSMQEIEAKIAEDWRRDPLRTNMDLINIAVEARLKNALTPLQQDIEERKLERQDRQLRDNLTQLAKKDVRVLDPTVFDAINAKLEANPELWNLQNPHRAAWLEVKEEMRLGDPSPGQAQPSRTVSPILGGGTPPPPQSSGSGALTQDTVAAALGQANFKDKMQVENLEKAVKALADQEWRTSR